MAREGAVVAEAKRSYNEAKRVGNRREEARWANVIGDILKNKGEYVAALKWLRLDYEVSVKYLPEKDILPTCQSLGEVYLRLQFLKDALIYQKKHLELAKDAEDLVEQQRASTQLGRTYHEMFSKSDDDHYAIRNAKKYFKLAMKLAETLRQNQPGKTCSFLKEYIDAHNNIGMLQMDLDNLEEAKKILSRGLEICDEEEVDEDDDGRSRLHHNLGFVYMQLRDWDEAREHIEKDIIICKRIGHCQGEAKGYINLGELHNRVHKYEEAIRCYQKAQDLAKTMQDEDALAEQINQNIEIVKESMKVMVELRKEEQNFKKLIRNMVNARGTPRERRCLLQQNELIDHLIEKSRMISAWSKLHDFSERKKRLAMELCDKEKLGDSFLFLGESYQKLRNFKKSIKWCTKSWETYKSIGNFEGQALAKLNIGDALDCDGHWTEALDAFEEGFRIATEANLPSVQLSAMENMHYSHMIRFDNVEEARRLKLEIEKLKQSKNKELEAENLARDCCSETETEADDPWADGRSDNSGSSGIKRSTTMRTKSLTGVDNMSIDVPSISILQCTRLGKEKLSGARANTPPNPTETSPKCYPKPTRGQQAVIGRKRIRVILSDDEGDTCDDTSCSNGRFNRCQVEEIATSDEFLKQKNASNPAVVLQDIQRTASRGANSICTPYHIEESSSSYKSQIRKVEGHTSKASSNNQPSASDFAVSGSKSDNGVFDTNKKFALELRMHDYDDEKKQYITFKMDNELLHLESGTHFNINTSTIESMKVDLACLYYLKLTPEKRSKGLLPIIQDMRCAGRVIECLEILQISKNGPGNIIEVSIHAWVQKRLINLYINCCEELSEAPNLNLLKKLYISEVEDEVITSECQLQDISISPLLNALHTHKNIAILDFSHNLLGNGTMEKLHQLFKSGQKYGDLTLDLHCNRFGPTALFQICECTVLFTRLEVLNISGNRLTDGCGSYLATILENCKALYSLNIEHCSITSRTVQKVADAINPDSPLTQLFIGHNSPVSGTSITNLLAKLATLKSFAELSLQGIKLNKPVLDSLSQLAKSSCLSHLMLGNSGIGIDGALQVSKSLSSQSQNSVILDLSNCGLTPMFTQKVGADISSICGIMELNCEGNPLLQEGANSVASLLANSQCHLKVLVLSNCQLGLAGVLRVIQALSDCNCLEELHLANNADSKNNFMVQSNSTAKGFSDILQPNSCTPGSASEMHASKESENNQEGICAINTDCDELEVADSEDDEAQIRIQAPASELDFTCTSSCHQNAHLQCQFIQELSAAIGNAKHLQFLDLSNNGFLKQIAEALYTAWSSRSELGSTWKHITDRILHFSLETNKCCRKKPCCRRD